MMDNTPHICEYKDTKAMKGESLMNFHERILDKNSSIFRQIRIEKAIGNSSSARSRFKRFNCERGELRENCPMCDPDEAERLLKERKTQS